MMVMNGWQRFANNCDYWLIVLDDTGKQQSTVDNMDGYFQPLVVGETTAELADGYERNPIAASRGSSKAWWTFKQLLIHFLDIELMSSGEPMVRL